MPRGRPPISRGVEQRFFEKRPVTNKRIISSGTRGRSAETTAYDDALRQRHVNGKIETKFGTIVKERTITLGEEPFTYSYIDPFALLHECNISSGAGASRYKEWLGSGTNKLAWHIDEARLGNALRPDAGRGFTQIIWTSLNLPEWFRCRRHGWFPFTVVPSKHCAQADTSVLVADMIQVFFASGEAAGYNFADGIELTYNGQTYTVTAEAGALVADGKALKEVLCAMGASGLNCCVSCTNVLNCEPHKIPPEGDRVHYTCSDPSLCIRHTHASMCEWADAVLEGQEALNVGQLKELQTLTGLHYIEGGLIWDPVARLHIDFGTFPYHDAMHALEASGGIAQYQLNVFVHNITWGV